MVTKKTKGLQILFMLMVLSLVACDSKPKYDDVIGYWKSESEIVEGKQVVMVFQEDYYSVMRNKEEVSFDEHDEYLSLFMDGPRGKNDYNVYITNVDDDTLEIAIPYHQNPPRNPPNPIFYTYVRTTKEDAEKMLGKKLD